MEHETTALVQADPFSLMDQLDDKAIMAEIEGRVVDKWVYKFDQDGKTIEGLSKVGVDQACREMATHGEVIREEDVSYQVDPTDAKFVLFKASAVRVAVGKGGAEALLERTFGTKRQCVFIVTRSGIGDKQNPFWYEQGSIKALRNARMRLISEDVRAAIILKARSSGKVEDIKPSAKSDTHSEPSLRTKIQSALAELVKISGRDPGSLLMEFSEEKNTEGKVFKAESLDKLMKSEKWAKSTYQKMVGAIENLTSEVPTSGS